MKRLSFHFALLFVSFFCICGMCSKSDNNNQQPPIKLEHSKGFLCSFGVLNDGSTDTVVVRYGPSEPVIQFTSLWIGSLFVRDKHTWEITNSGANTWYIKYADGRYLGYKYDENGIGDGRFRISLDQTPGEQNMFVINKTDNKFYIQPMLNKDIYLNTIQVNVNPPSPRHSKVDYRTGQKQMWFIVP